MCKCTPNIRTPFCGRPGCEVPPHWKTEPASAPDYTLGGERGAFYFIACNGRPMSAADVVAALQGGKQ